MNGGILCAEAVDFEGRYDGFDGGVEDAPVASDRVCSMAAFAFMSATSRSSRTARSPTRTSRIWLIVLSVVRTSSVPITPITNVRNTSSRTEIVYWRLKKNQSVTDSPEFLKKNISA